MQSDVIIEVNKKRKKLEAFFTVLAFLFVGLVILSYFVYFKNLGFFQDSILTDIVGHVKSQIVTFSILGAFYTALFGGLFFIFVPMEPLFIKALSTNNPIHLFLLFITGIFISYSLDYFIGMKFSKLSRRLISPKKFYKIKIYLNKYGKIAIFLASALPLPSQQVTFILGVFRYSKMRLFVLTMSGQILKYGVIILFFKVIL